MLPDFMINVIAFLVAAAIIAFVIGISLTVLTTVVVTVGQILLAGARAVGSLVAPRTPHGRHAVGAPEEDTSGVPTRFDTTGWEPDEVDKKSGEVKTWVYKGAPAPEWRDPRK